MLATPRTAEQFVEDQSRKWADQRATGLLIRMKDASREGRSYWARKAWSFRIQHDFRVKVLVLERLEFDHSDGARAYPWAGERGAREYGLGYYTLGGYRSGRGRWLWGQFSPMMPKEDFDALLQVAREEGTLLD